jgi:hypothetical protein
MKKFRASFLMITEPFWAENETDARLKMAVLANSWFREHENVLPLVSNLVDESVVKEALGSRWFRTYSDELPSLEKLEVWVRDLKGDEVAI